ncbi:MAG: hypothetical protein FWF63_10685 [Fibromonadales bacterium]|nr:hypothetical protein [Fibromonadales bacterium]
MGLGLELSSMIFFGITTLLIPPATNSLTISSQNALAFVWNIIIEKMAAAMGSFI